ncbi:MAG TPA: FHA domain-containing protein [Gemmataceae bacterium]|nr:FHA domain-containing protein [Gemmataceae bacterium]
MPDKPDGPLPETRELTRLESDKDVRDALEVRRAQKAARLADGKAGACPEPDVHPDRPVLRPPIALLTVLDDGRTDGEVFRLRADHTVIGRTEGDIRIPHDFQISARHAEIARQKTSDGYRWLLVDLKSTNGTFVRIGNTVLHAGNEILIGSGRYCFEGGAAVSEAPEDAGGQPTTQAWKGNPVRSLVPSLVELAPSGPVQRHLLTLPEYWIGRDGTACAIARPDDTLVSPRHARLFRNPRGQWVAENKGSLNGLWLRVTQMSLNRACQLRVGEQRFLFRPL